VGGPVRWRPGTTTTGAVRARSMSQVMATATAAAVSAGTGAAQPGSDAQAGSPACPQSAGIGMVRALPETGGGQCDRGCATDGRGANDSASAPRSASAARRDHRDRPLVRII